MLTEIVERCRSEIAKRDRASWETEITRRLGQMDQPPSFRKAIDRASESFIFEIKRRAPSYRGDDLKIEAVETARFYVEHGVTAISVLTEPHYFGGCLEELEQVARAVSVPVIRKDFIVDKAQIAEARAYGAAAVLLIAEVLPGPHLAEFIAEAECVGIDALVEIHSRQDLDRVLDTNAGIIGVNNRNLRTMEIDMLHGERLLNQIPTTRLKIAESGLNRRSDITRFRMAGADAFLIGTSVLKCDNPTRKIRELMGL